ncbi:hypothetical protein F4861DRAFT_546287 [Xylaria intraflava]|nr:hypothetical protein F4861DRAFT_546287 [Xylaria intraflava]
MRSANSPPKARAAYVPQRKPGAWKPSQLRTQTRHINLSPENNPDEGTAEKMSTSPIPDTGGGVPSIPEPGGTYMIRHMDSGKALRLINGSLTLSLIKDTGGGWHWHCEELPNGWIGFREAVSGKYLGHDNNGGYRATAGKMGRWESFVLRPRDRGGINLWVSHWYGLKAVAIAEPEKSGRLVDAAGSAEAARWVFIRV